MADNTDEPVRDGGGKFVYTMDSMTRDAKACELRSAGRTYSQIAEELKYPNQGCAFRGVQRAIKEILQEPAEEVRQLELQRLDNMYASVVEVMERQHFTVSNGRIIYHGDSPLPDDSPVLQAVDRLLKIQERRSKLLGLDAAQKTQVSGGVRYEVVGVDLDKLT